MCVISEGGIEVWILISGARWERGYELSMKELIDESPENLYLGLPSDETPTRFPLRTFVAPLAFDGRNLYVAVGLKEWCF